MCSTLRPRRQARTEFRRADPRLSVLRVCSARLLYKGPSRWTSLPACLCPKAHVLTLCPPRLDRLAPIVIADVQWMARLASTSWRRNGCTRWCVWLSDAGRNFYFPPGDVNMEYFEGPTDLHTTCGWKGVASYYDVKVGEGKAKVRGETWKQRHWNARLGRDHVVTCRWSCPAIHSRQPTARPNMRSIWRVGRLVLLRHCVGAAHCPRRLLPARSPRAHTLDPPADSRHLLQNAAWFYPAAKDGAKAFEGYVAFYTSKVAVRGR